MRSIQFNDLIRFDNCIEWPWRDNMTPDGVISLFMDGLNRMSANRLVSRLLAIDHSYSMSMHYLRSH